MILVTIKDVACAAGVSVGTVSRAINGTVPVTEKSKRKIFEAMEKLNYKPHAFARGLALKKASIIGIVVPRNSKVPAFGSQFVSYLNGVDAVTSDSGYSILLCIEKDNLSFLDLYRKGAVDGLIFTLPRLSRVMEYHALANESLPFIVAGNIDLDLPIDTADIDNVESAYMATEHLITLGHRNIGCIAPAPLEFAFSADRLRGYRKAMAAHCLDFDLVSVGQFSRSSGYQSMDTLLDKNASITAVFVGADCLAYGAMDAIHARGLRIPDDVAVVGFDNLFESTVCNPSLTSVKVDFCEIGRQAAEGLLRRIKSDNGCAIKVKVKTELIIRNSCGGRGEASRAIM